MTDSVFKTYSPIDMSLYYEGQYSAYDDIEPLLPTIRKAQLAWAQRSKEERVQLLRKWIEVIESQTQVISEDLCHSIGRPLQYCGSEVMGLAERARYMLDIAASTLADDMIPEKPGFKRFIRYAPKGVVFIIAPWNYPYLTSINAIIPALAAGNAVVLKPSIQTPKTADFYAKTAMEAGLPEDLFHCLFMNHSTAKQLMQHEHIQHVVFTGSVAGGKQIEQNLAGTFKTSTLELGGKDPAYLRADADLESAVPSVLDGAFFNSGQSCCGIERIYVHESLYEGFLEQAKQVLKQQVLGHPLTSTTTLGPMIKAEAARYARAQIQNALTHGAELLLANEEPLRIEQEQALGEQYLHPRIIINADNQLSLMQEETFGPIVGVQAVRSDQEAIEKMNASCFGLTAAIYSGDLDAVEQMGQRIEAGTVFLNRCDYLDPALTWSGVKQSGRGYALSHLGFHAFIKPKSFHLKIQ